MADLRASAAQPFAADDSLSGTIAGRFQITARLGRGGMGEVYRAEDTRLKRSVALKRLGSALRADGVYRRRFQEEAERASRFTDSHVAAVYDVIEENSELFLVMEYVEGQNLRQRLRSPVTLEEFFDIATQCAEALAAAHERRIVHCDIKPENIMLTSAGQVKILDFGVAKHLPRSDQSSTIDRDGSLGGTPAYMAPEVLLEKIPDGRADIFSLGIVLYESLTGHHPFLASSFVATSERILHETPTPIRIFNHRVPEALEGVIAKTLAKEPGSRYPDARALLEDLHLVQAGLTPSKLQPLLPRRTMPRFRRWVVAGIMLALAVAAGVFVANQRGQPAPILAERGWVLIADFDSRGEDPIPEAAVREGLTVALQQSRYVNVFPRTRIYDVLQRMKKPEVTRIDENLGREICQRESLQVLLAGSIEHVGQVFQITVRATEPVHGTFLFAEQERFSRKEEFFDKADELSRRVREDLGESRVGIEKASKPLANVTTSSLEALQLYSEAADFTARGKTDPVPALLQGALQLDPNFAMAHRLMARVYLIMGNRRKMLESLGRAYSLREGVTDRERRIIEADYFSAQGQYEKSVESLVSLVGLYPDDVEAHGDLATAYYSVGDLADATQQIREVLQRDPFSSSAYDFLVLLLARSNQNDEAVRVYQEAAAKHLETARIKWALGWALLGKGDLGGARKAFAELQGTGYRGVGQVSSARVALYEGKFSEAEQILNAQLRSDTDADNRSAVLLERYLLASSYLLTGKPDLARQQLSSILAAGDPENLQAEDLRRAGTLYAESGDPNSARKVLSRLDWLRSRFPTSFNQSCYYNLAASLALREGHDGQALQLYTTAAATYPRYLPHEGLARVYAYRQDWKMAAQEWRKVLDARGEILQDYFSPSWVLAHLELARAYAHLQDYDLARQQYQQFLNIWEHAEPNVARQEAVAETAELAAAHSRSH